jgi:hypothetical protein
MTWHYQARKRIDKDDVWFEVAEVYSGGMATTGRIAPTGSTKKELIQDLERMLADVKAYAVLQENYAATAKVRD